MVDVAHRGQSLPELHALRGHDLQPGPDHLLRAARIQVVLPPPILEGEVKCGSEGRVCEWKDNWQVLAQQAVNNLDEYIHVPYVPKVMVLNLTWVQTTCGFDVSIEVGQMPPWVKWAEKMLGCKKRKRLLAPSAALLLPITDCIESHLRQADAIWCHRWNEHRLSGVSAWGGSV